MVGKPKKDTVEDAISQLDGVRSRWLRRPGVTAVDVGFKISDGELTDQVALRVHVARKIPVEALPDHEVFNASEGAPEELGGFPIDVVEADYAPARAAAAAPVAIEISDAEAVDRRGVVSPLLGGISCGNPRITAGTLGAIVFDRNDCSAQILSNWHVLAGSNAAAAGEAIWQPGKFDGGSSANAVATLNRFRLDQDMDAAIARLDGARPHTRDILGLSPLAGVDTATLGTEVVKSGRTTEVTRGIVDGVSLSVTLDYGSGVIQTFNDQLHIVPRPPWPSEDYELSRGGDSGSVWVKESNRKAVGLHFAGETDPAPVSEHAIANRMTAVADGLAFSVLPLVCLGPTRRRIPRDILRLRLCRRFPWLCEPLYRRPWPPRPGPWPGPWTRGWMGAGPRYQEPAMFGLDAAPDPGAGSPHAGYGDAADVAMIDALIDAIYEEMDG